MTRCIQTIRNSLSLRLAELIFSLYSASLGANPEETRSEDLLKLVRVIKTSEEDNFIGSVDNFGTKSIFYDLLNYQKSNTCIYLTKDQSLRRFECTLMLEGCKNRDF